MGGDPSGYRHGMRAAWLEIDLSAYQDNLRGIRALCGPTGVLAVVKANAYGHGLVEVARAARSAGCDGLAVALPEEGIELREAGIGGPILVLTPWASDQAGDLVRADLSPVVCGEPHVAALVRASRALRQRVAVHLKVDTGLSRAGVEPERAVTLCRQILDCSELRLAGVMTHFAAACEDPESTREQWERFQPLIPPIRRMVTPAPVFHAANSAAALWHPAARLDLVRPGLVTYGVFPPSGPRSIGLRPVLSLLGRITQLRWVPPAARVGYGGEFVTERRTLLGIVPLGYADGLPWRVGSRARAIVRGHSVPVAGRISMDQVILDLTDAPGVDPGGVAVFIGRDAGEEITVSQIAEAAGTIPYEVLTRLSERLPRVYRGLSDTIPAPAEDERAAALSL
jgi:alanine racemase